MATMTETGWTGCLFEWSVLGNRLVTSPDLQGHMPYQEAMALARDLAPWNPTDPDPRPANDLHFHVCEALGVEDYSEVRLYSALGTPLDHFHGVDCWIEYGSRVVTIDLTTNEDKDCYKADVIVHPGDLEDEGRRIAKHIATLLRKKAT